MVWNRIVSRNMLYVMRALVVLPQYLVIGLIRFYQRFISPHKGFCCARHQRVGGRSCSNFALVAVRRYGVSALWQLFPKRLEACKVAAMRLNEEKDKKRDYCDCSVFDSSCGEVCDCDLSVKYLYNRRYLSFSPFFLLRWMYKLSSKRRGRFR